MKKTYRFVSEVTISVAVEVEAKTLEQAIKLAQGAPMQSFCHQCSNGEDGAWSTSGELDGEVSAPTETWCDEEEVPALLVKELW